MAEIVAERYTGASIKRSEDPRILTGAGRYVDDIKLPGMLHAAFVRSPLAHGLVLSVDATAARELPGVIAVLTGADLEAMTVPAPDPLLALFSTGGPTPEFTLLATDKVRFMGDPVAVVIAESRYLAEDGCELVEVGYDDLPPVMNAAFALDPDSPPLFANLGDNIARAHSRHEFGDVSGTFAQADRVVDVHIDVHRHQNVPMEGRGCVASWGRRPGGYDGLRGHAERAHHQERCRRAPGHRGRQGTCPGPRYRRFVRPENRCLAGRARRCRRVASARTAGQVGRGPRRERLEIRLRNIAARTDPPAAMITGRPLVGVTTSEALERVAPLADFPAFRRRQARARTQGRHLGIGVATFIEAAPGPRGTHCAIVDVDVETGIVKVERYIAVEDCGALINPAVVEGQIRGGVAQGIGAVLLERSAYGEDGSFQSATFMDYLMPTTCDVPRIEIEHLQTVPLDADVNFRGVGEGGMIVAPPTIVNAIEDAVTARRRVPRVPWRIPGNAG